MIAKQIFLSFAILTFHSVLQADDFQPDEAVVYKTLGATELKLHVFKPKGLLPDEKRPLDARADPRRKTACGVCSERNVISSHSGA